MGGGYDVTDYLRTGAENAIKARDLCEVLHISRRRLVKQIEARRRNGVPICASTDGAEAGYFIAANKGEMRRYCNSLFHRAGELHKTRRACLQTMELLPGDDATPIE